MPLTYSYNLKHDRLLIVIIVVYQAIGYGIGRLTRAGMPGWYDDLTKSPLTPPDPVFAVTWALLYVLLAIVTWRLIRIDSTSSAFFYARIIFAVQILANWGWSFAFFTAHWLLASFVWIAVLIGFNLVFVYLMRNIDRVSIYLLMPYIAWIGFACYLAGYIWAMNAA